MKEGTPLGARAQSAIQRAAVLYKPRLATFLLLSLNPVSLPYTTWSLLFNSHHIYGTEQGICASILEKATCTQGRSKAGDMKQSMSQNLELQRPV
jgi:hypothetical protein